MSSFQSVILAVWIAPWIILLRIALFTNVSTQGYFQTGLFWCFFSLDEVSAVGANLNIRNRLKADWQEPSAQTDLLFSLWQLVSSKAWGLQQAAFTARNIPWGAAAPALSLPVRLLATYLLSTFSVDAATCSQGMKPCCILILSMHWDFKAHLVCAWNNSYKRIHLWQTDLTSALQEWSQS